MYFKKLETFHLSPIPFNCRKVGRVQLSSNFFLSLSLISHSRARFEQANRLGKLNQRVLNMFICRSRPPEEFCEIFSGKKKLTLLGSLINKVVGCKCWDECIHVLSTFNWVIPVTVGWEKMSMKFSHVKHENEFTSEKLKILINDFFKQYICK